MATALFIFGLTALFVCGVFCGVAIKAYHASQVMKDLERTHLLVTRTQSAVLPEHDKETLQKPAMFTRQAS